MQIISAKFIKGIVGPDDILLNDTPQIAFIGRSNAGKSTLLNSLTGKKKLAIASKTPGRTKEINVFLVNNSHYFLDLPGYGYAKASNEAREKLSELIFWYLLDCEYEQKVVLLIDAIIGPTEDDLTVLGELEKAGRDIVVIANKADKIKKSSFKQHIDKLQQKIRGHRLIPYSSTSKIGIDELRAELLSE